MTREDKIKKRKHRSHKRRLKKKLELVKILDLMRREGYSFYSARKKVRGTLFLCEMRYGDCEERGYCNGDC